MPDELLNLDLPWRIRETTFAAIVADLKKLRPSTIVEFGSGASSIRLAQEFPKCSILSIDHKAQFSGRTVELKEQFARASRLQIELRPLKWQRHGLCWYQSYSLAPLPENIDAAIIDGPPLREGCRGREACLYQAFKHLRLGGRIYLDDYQRSAEQQIVANWLAAYAGSLDWQQRSGGHGLCILQKLREVPRKTRASIVSDNLAAIFDTCKRQLREMLARPLRRFLRRTKDQPATRLFRGL